MHLNNTQEKKLQARGHIHWIDTNSNSVYKIYKKAYDIKRGFGKHDAGKTISLKRALISTHILLRNYGKTKSITVKSENCEAKLICYYGEKTLPSPLSIDKDEIDKHFKVSILKDIESINQYYKEKLNELIEKI